jgi:hypothetical protein
MNATGIANASAGLINVTKHSVAISAAMYWASYVMADTIEGGLQLRCQGSEDASPSTMCSKLYFL